MDSVISLRGSPEPPDLFQPRMPSVDLLEDMDGLFARARGELDAARAQVGAGQCPIAVVTPDRTILLHPCPPAGSIAPEFTQPLARLMPPEPILDIAVVGYTNVKALQADKSKSIPFFGQLLGFGYLGHRVIVFEGHPTALASGVRNSDALIVDSGMLPFIQDDWLDVALEAMHPEARAFVHDRTDYSLHHVTRNANAAPEMSFTPRLPGVTSCSDLPALFAEARERARSSASAHPIVVVSPERKISILEYSLDAAEAEAVQNTVMAIAPSSEPANVLVVACNEPERLNADVRRAIPCIGIVKGLAEAGHNVVVFEGQPDAYAAATQNADLLVLDGGMEPFLPPDWKGIAHANMKIPRVAIFLRDGFVLFKTLGT